ncbi:MAG TPA: Npt1/Npt2 family nucleotide transporter [Bdellovibrionota bacterium]|nr:Npt1/Npt2 family nucleotide transporter [Bdellovibrionota bacterium]
MKPAQRLTSWLDIRPGEFPTVALCFLGAFFVVGMMILGRSLREALYLGTFDVKTLPYITTAVVVLALPTIGTFSKLMARYGAQRVLRYAVFLFAMGLLALWPVATQNASAVVVFYLWTALGAFVLTSGFWVVTAEFFPIRRAKRLFALISAGGTIGALTLGTSIKPLIKQIGLVQMIPALIGLVGLFLLLQVLLPARKDMDPKEKEGERTSTRESLHLVWRNEHLRTLASIVFAATLASTLLDYQFKEQVRASLQSREQLAGFFGSFYGWTGLISLLLQVVVTAPLLARTGVGTTFAVLPMVLLAGSTGLFLLPGLIAATLARGADNSIRKSIFRSAVEVVYIPLPTQVRRKTKTFIDSLVDAAAEGAGSGLIFLCITLGGLPSKYLSILVGVSALGFLGLSRQIGRKYFETLVQQLRDKAEPERMLADARFEGRGLLTATFSRLGIAADLEARGLLPPSGAAKVSQAPVTPTKSTTLERIQSKNPTEVRKALMEKTDWNESHAETLVRLLAQKDLQDLVTHALVRVGAGGFHVLAGILRDENNDFVIRRRIPRVLAKVPIAKADEALVVALGDSRFEVRYRSAIALANRRKHGLPVSETNWKTGVWEALKGEVSRGKPVWELHRLLDETEPEEDDLVSERVGRRGELGIEHTFRMLALVLEPEAVRAAYYGILLENEKLRSFALEYLEQVLPADLKKGLWPFIGDLSDEQKRKTVRPIDHVVSDLLKTGATLFASDEERSALKELLKDA